MANEEHLKILSQGIKAWNKWRKQNPHIELDLGGLDIKFPSLFPSFYLSILPSNLEFPRKGYSVSKSMFPIA